MPRNLTTGVFTRVNNSFSNPVLGTDINPTDADSTFDDFDSGMTFNAASPLILVGSSSGVTTVVAAAVATGTVTLPSYGGTVSTTWSNTRLAKTAAYVAANADKGCTLALGGALYSLTFNAASGYDADFAVLVLNESARGKTLIISGLTSFILWPGQQVWVYNQNNVWKTDGPYRWQLPAATTFYVSSAGSDSNDGLAAGSGNAFQTLQGAYLNVLKYVDYNNFSVTLQLANGTYSTGFTIYGTFVGGMLLYLRGDPTTPSNVILTGNLGVRDFVAVDINGMRVETLTPSQGGVIDVHNIEFSANPSAGFGWVINSGGYGNRVDGTYAILGNCTSHWFIQGDGTFSCPGSAVFSVPNTMTVTNFLLIYKGYFSLGSSVTFTGSGAGAGTTGSKYSVQGNGLAILNGATLPGATGGSTATGGQVI